MAQAARDLDLHVNVSCKWVRELSADPQQAFPGQGQMKPEQLEPELAAAVRAASASMSMSDFDCGAVRAFLETADDDLWFQLITVIRQVDGDHPQGRLWSESPSITHQ